MDDEEATTSVVYLYGLPRIVDEQILEEFFKDFSIEIDPAVQMPDINVHICARELKPRGDAIVRFTSHQEAQRAVELKNESKIRERYTVFCRLLDSKTKFMLEKQIYRPRATWICPTPKCQRAQISEWETTCRDCQGRRPRWIYDIIGGAEIRPSDWICSICMMTNRSNHITCQCCQTTCKD